jgi:hypothetical protein
VDAILNRFLLYPILYLSRQRDRDSNEFLSKSQQPQVL